MTKCCDVKACDLRHSITIQAEDNSKNDPAVQGDAWASPTTVATTRACITPLSGRERWRAMQVEDTTTHRILMRYRSGITAKHRIKFGSRIFNIRAVINLEERNRWLEIMAEEGVAT